MGDAGWRRLGGVERWVAEGELKGRAVCGEIEETIQTQDSGTNAENIKQMNERTESGGSATTLVHGACQKEFSRAMYAHRALRTGRRGARAGGS